MRFEGGEPDVGIGDGWVCAACGYEELGDYPDDCDLDQR